MLRIVFISFFVLLIVGCKSSDPFWYPVVLKHASCSTYTGEIYIMTNTTSWRSWAYIVDKATKQEIELGTDCTFRVIKRLPKYKRNIRASLTPEQRKYLIPGT